MLKFWFTKNRKKAKFPITSGGKDERQNHSRHRGRTGRLRGRVADFPPRHRRCPARNETAEIFAGSQKNADFAELVCSNSLRSDDYLHNAVGLMHEEMRRAGSLVMECADQTKVPAGGALAVDRDGFAALITQRIKSHPLISVRHEEIGELPGEDFGRTIIATGPLTSDKLAHAILEKTDHQALSFYDAIAPVVFKDSIDFSKAWYQSRYDKGDRLDYINCPLSKEEYYRFVDELLKAQKVEFHDFEEAQYFDGCLPVEVMAERGIETLVFGPMKPVGLTNPHRSEKPYAVVQLRQDNKGRHAAQHGRFSDQNEIRRAGTDFPNDSRAGKSRICTIGRHS